MGNQDSAAAKTTEQKEEAVTILLIAHKQNQFSSAAAFLTRRGIPCTLRGNIKDAIAFITKHKPTYVFLSWNLPNSNIIKTHKLFVKNFDLQCVVFAETSDGKTAAELANSRIPETMQAPVSGPGLYMRLQKLMKSKSEDGKNPPEVRQTRDGYKKEDQKTFIQMSSGPKKEKPGMINFQTGKAEKVEKDEAYISSNSSDENDISAYLDEIESNDEELLAEFGNNNGADEFESSVESSETEEHRTTQDGNASSTMTAKRKKKEIDYGTVVNIAKKAKDISSITHQDTKQNVILNFTPTFESKTQESILFQQTLEALKQSLRDVYTGYESINQVSKAKLLNIHTHRFRGYMIMVVPMFFEMDRALFLTIKENLLNLLKSQGEEPLYFEELNVDLEQVHFISWCKNYAEFFIQTADHKNEIICAYFPIEPSMPRVEEMAKMASIEVRDLKPNTKTNFNLFIHLPKNNKFLRYLKPGDMITAKHTEKFEKNNLKNLHIKKDEISLFKEYFASQKINEVTRKKK